MYRWILASLLLLVACGDSGTAPEFHPARHTGVYVLDSVNGVRLPFLLEQLVEDRIEVVAGSIELHEDGTFTDRATFQLTGPTGIRTEESATTGRYSRGVSLITFRSLTNDGSYRGAISPNAITIDSGGLRAVYRR